MIQNPFTHRIFAETVPAGTALVLQRPGQTAAVLSAGRHRLPRRAQRTLIGLREDITSVALQEVLTAEQVSVKVSAVIRWRVVDPVAYVSVAERPFERVYVATQLALREAVAGLSAAEVTSAGRRDISARLTGAAAAVAIEVGIEVAEAGVKDIVLPAELRAAYAELATAKQRAAAKLEAARAETAALRSLANGAKLLDQHPALARQRLVEALPYGAQVTLMTGADQVSVGTGS